MLFFPRLFAENSDPFEHQWMGEPLEARTQFNAFIRSMQGHTNGEQLLEGLHELLLKVVRLRSYQIIILDEAAHYLTVFRSHPKEPSGALSEFNTASHIYHYFRKTKAMFLSKTPVFPDAESTPELAKARKQLTEFDADYCFSFTFQNACFGFILLGPKLSGKPYSHSEIELLEKLVLNLSTAINQIRLMNHVLHGQEQELLGRMSRGMAHDLNNLLTPISTYLQLADDIPPDQAPNYELLQMAMHNLHAIHAYIRESLFISQNLTPNFKHTSFALLLSNTVELIRVKLNRQKIQVALEIPDTLTLDLDEILIQRLFTNLISNAIDASPDGSVIQVKATPLVRAQSDIDWLRIQVIDHGTGISNENLGLASMPYFTTKTSGDTHRGFGLGLAICRKIADVHGGTVTLSNSQTKGTTVTVDLPCAQTQPAQWAHSPKISHGNNPTHLVNC